MYKKVLATYKKKGRISTAFHSVGVNRNTGDECPSVRDRASGSRVPSSTSKVTLNQYVRRITKNAIAKVSNAIKEKRLNELLPITYKFK